MTYILVGYPHPSFHDSGEPDTPAKFDTLFYGEDERSKFIRSWAEAEIFGTYDDLQIIINGIPRDHMTNEEYGIFEKELTAQKQIVKSEYIKAAEMQKMAETLAAKEKDRQVAEKRARQIAEERAIDLRQYEELMRKLRELDHQKFEELARKLGI